MTERHKSPLLPFGGKTISFQNVKFSRAKKHRLSVINLSGRGFFNFLYFVMVYLKKKNSDNGNNNST